MLKNTKLTRNLAKLILVAVFFSLTSCGGIFKQELYTIDECRSFKKGDTIFAKEFHSVKRCVVLNNYPSKELIEIRYLQYTWDVSVLSYDDFRFK
jgi:hypothetical protein